MILQQLRTGSLEKEIFREQKGAIGNEYLIVEILKYNRKFRR